MNLFARLSPHDWRRLPVLFATCLCALFLCGCQPRTTPPATADTPSDVLFFRQCAGALQELRANDPDRVIDYFLEDAQGVLIFPDIYKGGFIAGAQGGKGVLVARQAPNRWSAPVFYSLGGASFGYQIGLQRLRAVFIFMDRQAMTEGLDAGLTLDANHSWSVLTGGEAGMLSTMTMNNGVIAFLGVEGLYAGVSMQGGFMKPETRTTQAFYKDQRLTPKDLLLTPYPPPTRASALYDALHKAVADLPPGRSIPLYP